MVVWSRAFPRGVVAVAFTMVAANCGGRSVSESNGSGSGGSAGTPSTDPCLLPIDEGTCDMLALRWGFNLSTGQCKEFNWGGCGRNENNFETEAECVARCEPTSDATACMSPGDCALVDPVCCRCDPALSDLLAVHSFYVNDILAPCALVDCEGCPGPAFSPWFTSLCEAGQCIAVDTREHELTRCSVDTDCRLRMGFGCCDCGSEVVAVSVNVSVEALVCPESGCMADCAPQYPFSAFPRCMEDGHCGIVHLLPLN